jgi:polyribonucleotide nucleotidyltransferase|eukprot:SAG25_NODE_1245_length_3510_cov_1468.316431_7_plen_125_part_00
MISSESGAKVDVSKDSNEVTISGEPSQVAKAKQLIKTILEGGDVGPPPEAEKRIETSSAGAVIGRKGETIRKIQETSGARVDISKDSSGPDVIVISGARMMRGGWGGAQCCRLVAGAPGWAVDG